MCIRDRLLVELSVLEVLNSPKLVPILVIKLPTLDIIGTMFGILAINPIRAAPAALIGNARLSPNAFLSLGSI